MNSRLIPLIFFIPVFSINAIELDLASAERLAIEASKTIRNNRQQLELSALNSILDFRSFLPQIEINYSSSRQVTINAPDSDNLQLGIELNQPVFDGGRLLKSHALSDILLHIKAVELDRQVDELRNQVWQLFYGLLLNHEKLKLQKELLEISALQLTITFKKYELGSLTELDYLEAAIEVQNMKIDILETENEGTAFERDFAQLLGFDPCRISSTPLKLKGEVDREYQGLWLLPESLHAWMNFAIRGNIDLAGKRADLNQFKAELEVLRSSWIPELSVEASFFLTGTRLPLQQPGFSLALKIDFPYNPLPSAISAGGGSLNSLQNSQSVSGSSSLLPDLAYIINEKSASLNLMQAGESLNDSITGIKRSVYSLLENMEHKRLSINSRRKTQDLLVKKLKLLETRNLMGEITHQDLLKARIDYYEKEITLREAIIDLLQSEREFERLLGLGLGELNQISEVMKKDLSNEY